MRKNWLKKGLSLVEILGASTVIMALASVAVVSVKDSLKAGQRSAIQRELQSLNTALTNFKSAGGVIEDGSLAEDAIKQMRYGVGVSDMERFNPLTEDPDLLKEIDGETYRLDYNEKDGFTYVPDSGQEAAFSDAGRETNSLGPDLQQGLPPGGYGFDTSDRDDSLDALNGLGGINPEDPAFGNTLEGLNAAYDLGTLTDEDMLAAGLVRYNDEWMTPEMARSNLAQEALDVLSSGGLWGELNTDQQKAYVSIYPQSAVEFGGASALNLMDPSTLTPSLVSGYAKIGSTWVKPTGLSTGTASSVTPSIGDPKGSGFIFVYAVSDPLAPAVHVGTLNDIRVTYRGNYLYDYYSYTPLRENLNPGGSTWGSSWGGDLSTATYSNTSYASQPGTTMSSVTNIDSAVPGTTQIIYVRQ